MKKLKKQYTYKIMDGLFCKVIYEKYTDKFKFLIYFYDRDNVTELLHSFRIGYLNNYNIVMTYERIIRVIFRVFPYLMQENWFQLKLNNFNLFLNEIKDSYLNRRYYME